MLQVNGIFIIIKYNLGSKKSTENVQKRSPEDVYVTHYIWHEKKLKPTICQKVSINSVEIAKRG